jgi:uncharacterized phage-associated protein
VTISVLSAAKRLGIKSGWTLSNLELQKIIYLAHMFYMGENAGSPLVFGQFEAWDYGPVHPDLYRVAKVFGSDPVQNVFHSVADVALGPEQSMLDKAVDALGKAGPGRLVNATHKKNGAWDKNYHPPARHCVIPNSDIMAEYKGLERAEAGR